MPKDCDIKCSLEVVFAFEKPSWRDRLFGLIFESLIQLNPWAGDKSHRLVYCIEDVLFANRIADGAVRFKHIEPNLLYWAEEDEHGNIRAVKLEEGEFFGMPANIGQIGSIRYVSMVEK